MSRRRESLILLTLLSLAGCDAEAALDAGGAERCIHADDELPPVVRAGLLHVQFETIPPTSTATVAWAACS